MPASLEARTPIADALASLRAMVLPDVALQEALGDIEDFDVFAARTAEAARARGVALDAEPVRDLLYTRPEPPSIDGFTPSPGWLPAAVTQIDGRATITSLRSGRVRPTATFYDPARTRQRFRPFVRLPGANTPLCDL